MNKQWNIFCFFICCIFFYPMQMIAYQFEFAVAAIFKNEAPYLKEWIEYNRLVGAEHFYLYNNESSDDFCSVLQPYLEAGIVELVDWTEPDFQFSGQKKAYLDAINKAKLKTKWLAVIDIDEYLVPKVNETIPDFLKAFEVEGIGGVGVNWQMFGTSYVKRIEPGDLLIAKLVMKAPEWHHENLHVKSIVRPEYVIEPPHIHYFEYIAGWRQVDASKNDFEKSFTVQVHIDKIQINHYWSKDEYFFNTVKIPRRLKWGEPLENIYKRLFILNQVYDYSIYRFIPKLKYRIQNKLKCISV